MIPGITAGKILGGSVDYFWVQLDALASDQEVVVGDYTQCAAFVIGAAGGGGLYLANQGASGAGGYAFGVFSVTEGETLVVRVGNGGQGGFRGVASYGGAGGWPGGGSGSFGDTYCGGGGGYSGVFRAGSPLVIAGGGGGGSGYQTAAGAGGGAAGQAGSAGAAGGTQSAGGAGAYPGSAYQGGNANGGNRLDTTLFDCGGGGGGLFGGAAPNADGGRGAGGSGHVSSLVSGATYAGSGMSRPAEVPATINGVSTAGFGVGVNGIVSANGSAVNGGNGLVWLRFSA